MVRIKFTGPGSAVQLQHAKAIDKLVSNNAASVQNKAQAEIGGPLKQAIQERVHLKQQQSLEMVQIMLHVSFGTLFYLREFLPLPCFDDRDLKEAQREHNALYRQFINGKPHSGSQGSSPEVPFGKGKRGQPLKIIVRGSDPKADTILDVLENGIFDALSKNVLEAIQLTICVDKDVPENVLESYTFSFKYTGGSNDVNRRLESLSIDPVGYVADMKTAKTARIGLETIIRRLITLSAFLPTLPNKRNLGIHLFYTDSCSPDYEPPGFATARNEIIKYPHDDNWKRESQSCGTMDSGRHSVGLKVTSLKWTGPEPDGSEATPMIPQEIEYNDVVNREADIGFANDTNASCGVENGGISISEGDSPLEQSQPSIVSGDRDMEGIEATTQDITEKHKLQMMMMPTQRTSSYPDSNLVPTQPINPHPALDGDHKHTNKTGEGWVLSPKRVNEIRDHLASQKPGLSGESASQKRGLVKCQCGWEGEETAMIQCDFCYRRQHLLCYGFENTGDPKLPDVHACYQCLLEPNETQVFRKMNTLVLLRRALRIIMNEGFPNQISSFSQKLHCNGQTVIQITDILRKQKFLQPTPGNKIKGFLQKGLPKFTIPSSDDVRLRLDREILDPMVKIQHHYIQQDSQGSAGSLKSITCPEYDTVEKLASQDKELPINECKPSDGEVKDPSTRPVGDSEKRQTRKRKGLLISDDSQGREAGDLENDGAVHEQRSSNLLNRDDQVGKSLHSTGTRMTPHQKKSPRQPTHEGQLRRSSRKRRKASNYPEPIDVGIETSGNESA